MTAPRAYLLDRFRADAEALRHRVASLRSAGKGAAAPPGPDAATSERMAQACDDVVATIAALPDDADAARMVTALASLVPLFEQRAQREAKTPAVRAVYAGAATRIQQIARVEQQARSGDQDVDVDEGDFDDDDDN